MHQEDILRLLRDQPFRPCRVHLSNGDTHDVRHPELVWVSRSTMMLAVPFTGLPAPAIDDYITMALIHINKIDYLAPLSPSQQAST